MATGRYLVKLSSQGDEDRTEVSLKPGNLLQKLAGVRLTRLRCRPELNGLTGSIKGYDDATGRYEICVNGDGRHISVKRNNLVLPIGAVGRLTHLPVQFEHLNGAESKVLCFDERTGLYLVEMATSIQGGARHLRVSL